MPLDKLKVGSLSPYNTLATDLRAFHRSCQKSDGSD
jgi:hypothetical protein